jgi:hypothetical protein
MQTGVAATDMIRGSSTVEPGAFTPIWKLTDDCQDCTQAIAEAAPAQKQLHHIAARKKWGTGQKKTTCAGLNVHGDWGASLGRSKDASCAKESCAKVMETPGRHQTRFKVPVAFNLDHCKALAARDSECNDDLVFFFF